MFSWNFLKAFSNSLETLADGSNDGAPKFRDCVENIKNNFFQQHKKLHPMIPAKAGNLLINVEQLPRQEIRRPGSDVWDLNLNYSISYLNIYRYRYRYRYVQHTLGSRQKGQRTFYLELDIFLQFVLVVAKLEKNCRPRKQMQICSTWCFISNCWISRKYFFLPLIFLVFKDCKSVFSCKCWLSLWRPAWRTYRSQVANSSKSENLENSEIFCF